MIDEDELINELWKIDNKKHEVHLMDVIDVINKVVHK